MNGDLKIGRFGDLWFVIGDLWFVISDLWFVISDLWFVISDLWFVNCSADGDGGAIFFGGDEVVGIVYVAVDFEFFQAILQQVVVDYAWSRL